VQSRHSDLAGAFAGVDKIELVKAHRLFVKKFHERFGNVRRGFRMLDADNSGYLTRAEFRSMDDLFNLTISRNVMDCLIKLCDYDNSGVIKFAEFARVITAEDILNLKDTLVADPNMDHEFGSDFPKGNPREPTVKVPKVRQGVQPSEIRNAQKFLVRRLDAMYENPREAFEEIDKDGSNKLSRAELIGLMVKLNTGSAMREVVLQNLCDFVDVDMDGSIDYDEFMRVLESQDILSTNKRPPKALVR